MKPKTNVWTLISLAGVLLLPTCPATPATTSAEFWLSHPGPTSLFQLSALLNLWDVSFSFHTAPESAPAPAAGPGGAVWSIRFSNLLQSPRILKACLQVFATNIPCAVGGVQTITVNQQQPQVIQLQPQQQQQPQPQPQQQQAQAQQQMQPGAAAGPPGGVTFLWNPSLKKMYFSAFSHRLCTLCFIVLNQCLLSGIQIVQQIITPTGEIHQIPIQLNAQQLQVENVPVDFHPSTFSSLLKVIRAQMMGGAGSSQPIVIQTAPIQAQIAQPAQVNRISTEFS